MSYNDVKTKKEDSLAEIRTIEAEVATYLDHFFKYHSVRGKLVSKLAKYPHVVYKFKSHKTRSFYCLFNA